MMRSIGLVTCRRRCIFIIVEKRALWRRRRLSIMASMMKIFGHRNLIGVRMYLSLESVLCYFVFLLSSFSSMVMCLDFVW